jgi:hypothetical protein
MIQESIDAIGVTIKLVMEKNTNTDIVTNQVGGSIKGILREMRI